jgi:membrane protein implicated in regulation of membrane protease activity
VTPVEPVRYGAKTCLARDEIPVRRVAAVRSPYDWDEEAAMWAIAGILLGLVLVASLLGFHAGPHMHVAAGVMGLFAAGWLVAIALAGPPWPGLWVLLSADLVVSGCVGVLAWRGLTHRPTVFSTSDGHALEGAHGVAVTDLTPEGIVRVLGEQWSAVAANGSATAGTVVQVLRVSGVRLDVWAEEPSFVPGIVAPPDGEIGRGNPS